MQLRQSIFMQLIPRCHLRRSYFHATPFHFRPILLHNFAPQQFLHIIHSVVYDTQACGCVNYSVGYDVFNILTFIVRFAWEFQTNGHVKIEFSMTCYIKTHTLDCSFIIDVIDCRCNKNAHASFWFLHDIY